MCAACEYSRFPMLLELLMADDLVIVTVTMFRTWNHVEQAYVRMYTARGR